MINSYEKFRIPDEGKEADLIIDVNWEPKNPKTNKCQLLRLTYPNGQVAHVKKERLMAFLFAIGSEAEQRDMIPQQITKVRWYETVVGVKAKKDIRKGEEVRFPIKLSMPWAQDEVIKRSK